MILLHFVVHTVFSAIYLPSRAFLTMVVGVSKRNFIQGRISLLSFLRHMYDASSAGLAIPFHGQFDLVVMFDGSKFLCPKYDTWILGEIYGKKVYDCLFKPGAGCIVVDAGAHVGIYALKAAEEVGEKGLVIAVEPHPTNYSLLLANLKANRFRNVVALRAALGNRCGRTKLYLAPISREHSLVFKTNDWIEVEINTLDNVLSQLMLSHIDFLKIDVEGAELQVLEGAKQVLGSRGLKLAIAAYHTPTEVQDITRFLTSWKYTVLERGAYLYAQSPLSLDT